MRIKVHFDFTQQELVGKDDIFELAEGANLGKLLRLIDARIVENGRNKSIDTTYKTTLANGQLNACVVFINGAVPENMLEQELYDGDEVEFVYGFCGG